MSILRIKVDTFWNNPRYFYKLSLDIKQDLKYKNSIQGFLSE